IVVAFDAEHVVQDEKGVVDWSLVDGHSFLAFGASGVSSSTPVAGCRMRRPPLGRRAFGRT
ncbi:hypothetical protein WA845_25210, partial [Agrobacterium sp. CMT1]